ncbi:MAG: protein kinase [Labilithrix sp.]|nr:protein kinase [Labilithrix sp.]
MSDSRAEPAQLGRYTLLGRLAGGGMGTVHLARVRGERGFSRAVAVKLLHAHLAEDADIVTRFLDEARVAAFVKHPHVVSVLDVGENEGSPFLVLDYVHGDSFEGLLRAARKAGEPVPLDVVAAIGSDLLEGLDAAHTAKDDAGNALDLVHRDVSPHNVLVSEHGIAYVTDFGIAKVRDRLRLTRTNDMLGKAGYMAPEQLGGPGGVTTRTDVYGAGIVLWEALAGKKLFEGLEHQLLATVERTEAPLVSGHRPEVPAALDALVAAMLARDPAARPASAAACNTMLLAALPRASPSEVATWMRRYAQARLEKLEALLRAPAASSSASASASASDPAPSDPSPPDPPPPDPALTLAGVPAPLRAPERRLPRALLGLVVVLLGLLAASLAFRVRAPAAAVTAQAEPPAPAPTAPAPTSSAAPSVTAANSASSNDTSPPVLASASASARPSTRVPPRTRAAVASPSCSPPYEIVDHIKRYKRECFDPGR